MKLVIFSQNNTSNGLAKSCIHMRLNDQLFITINDCFLSSLRHPWMPHTARAKNGEKIVQKLVQYVRTSSCTTYHLKGSMFLKYFCKSGLFEAFCSEEKNQKIPFFRFSPL